MPEPASPSSAIGIVEAGLGPPVVLVHSSVSGPGQFRKLMTDAAGRFRFLAPYLIGYGDTPAWTAARPQTLDDQADVVARAIERTTGPVALVGHSFGGAIALRTAARLGAQIGRLVLLDPNPFTLLQLGGEEAGWQEIDAVRRHCQSRAAAGDWESIAALFADYWLGAGTWDAMPDKRRQAFVSGLAPNRHEWDAVMGYADALADVRSIAVPTLLVEMGATRDSIRGICRVLRRERPDWTHQVIAEAGHMAPLTEPDRVNPAVVAFLDARD